MLKFRLLGAVEVLRDGKVCTPTAPRVLTTLALVLVRANHVVGIEPLIDELWAEDPPRSAATTAQTYIYQLRRLIDQDQAGPGSKELLMTAAPGYLLRLEPHQLDLFEFERLTDEGRAHLDAQRPHEAADCLRSALALWSGAPLANVVGGRVLDGHRAALHEQYSHALNLRITADLQLGRHHQLIPELRALVAENPFNEWYHSLLVFTLGVVGRRRDALVACRQALSTLSDELGLEPSPEMSRIKEGVLRGLPVAPPSDAPFALAARIA